MCTRLTENYWPICPHRKKSSAKSAPRAASFFTGVSKVNTPNCTCTTSSSATTIEREFEAIRTTDAPGDDPTVYINISSKVQPSDAPDGCENWFVMVNVGANPDRVEDLVPEIRRRVLAKIERTLGTDIAPLIASEFTLTPKGLQDRTSSWRGALYGASSNSTLAAFLRHRNRSTLLKGLYFCGGSVHPGGGIPLCLLSARIATELTDSYS